MSQKHKNEPLPLKAAIKNAIESNTLDDHHLRKLLELQENSLEQSNSQFKMLPSHLSNRARKIASASAMFTLTIILILWMNTTPDYTQQIAREVSKNHLNLKPLDVQVQSMKGIRQYFTQLDFLPVKSAVLEKLFLRDGHLLGGRYCSIKGVTAAQLRYEGFSSDKLGPHIMTLYQVPYDPDIYGEMPLEKDMPKVITVRGLQVSLWVEKGLLMVLVSPV